MKRVCEFDGKVIPKGGVLVSRSGKDRFHEFHVLVDTAIANNYIIVNTVLFGGYPQSERKEYSRGTLGNFFILDTNLAERITNRLLEDDPTTRLNE